MQHVFIVGSKGIPGAYGGYETFVDKLTEYHEKNRNIKYHVACKGIELGEFEYHNAHCFKVMVPNIGPIQAIYYDLAALNKCCLYIKKYNISNPLIYILACRIGPFASHFQQVIHKLGGTVYVNPDGHEWMRAKWSMPVRRYWKLSEQLMVKHTDFLICDSKNIEKYILNSYKRYHPKTTFIPYGAEVEKNTLADGSFKLAEWYVEKGLQRNHYYLVVGRFVPENNFETIIHEFMKTDTDKDLAIITTTNTKFLRKLERRLHFLSDRRIKFVGTVYNQELLREIRKNAYGYVHGHEVGGTNPSLLEALGTTNLNLLLDVGFNREVGENAGLYWSKRDGDLCHLIELTDRMEEKRIQELGKKAKTRIEETYNWKQVAESYEKIFLNGMNK